MGFLTAYLTLQNVSNYTNPTLQNSSTGINLTSLPTPDPRTSEDCLFLDVVVPEKIFNSASAKRKRQDGPYSVQCRPDLPCTEVVELPQNTTKSGGATVLVWIYGGGYVAGDKTGSGNPASLIARSLENGSEGVIFVAMNYRLGLFVSFCIFLNFDKC